MRRRVVRTQLCARACPAVALRRVPRQRKRSLAARFGASAQHQCDAPVWQQRRHRCVRGRRSEKHYGDCHRLIRRLGLRLERPRRLGNARFGRNHPPCRRHGRAHQNHDGLGRHGRPDSHLHGRVVAQPQSGAGLGRRQNPAPSAQRNRTCCRRRAHHRRSAQRRRQIPN